MSSKATKKYAQKQAAKGAKKKTPVPTKTPSYRVDQDATLTPGQRKRKGFADIGAMLPASKKIKKGKFRNASNRTQHGYSSGYHEAGITTDTVDHLQQRRLTPPRAPAVLAHQHRNRCDHRRFWRPMSSR